MFVILKQGRKALC